MQYNSRTVDRVTAQDGERGRDKDSTEEESQRTLLGKGRAWEFDKAHMKWRWKKMSKRACKEAPQGAICQRRMKCAGGKDDDQGRSWRKGKEYVMKRQQKGKRGKERR